MITKEQSKKLKEVIGFRHISKVIEHLHDHGITNRYGRRFSSTYISSVFNGHLANPEVENAIWELSEMQQAEQERIARIREKIMTAETVEENE